jgi:cytochrome P450
MQHEALRVLTDAAFIPPPAQDGPPGGIRWLRANVARFSSGDAHRRRRSLAIGLLDQVDPASLRRRARELTSESLPDGASHLARHVPVTVLGEALGLTDVDAAAVRTVAAHYKLDTDDVEADAAVAVLVEAFGGVADEPTAAGIGLLVQACDATAGLIDNALRADAGSADWLVAQTLLADPPVRATLRQSVASGRLVEVDLTMVPFGIGAHQCPGRDHAAAIAAGVCEVLRDA